MTYPRYTITDDAFDADVINGKVYHCEATSETVADDGYMNFVYRTNQYPAKMRILADTAGAAYLTVVEGGSLNVVGNGEPVRNLNRIVGDTTFVGTITDAASVSGSTPIFENMWGAAGGLGNRSGGSNQFFFLLAHSSQYEIKLQNISGGAAVMNLELLITEQS